jgi:chemotaxis regulatin CheY-phosphate phosphatase CheZ
VVKQFAELITSENGVYFIVGTLFLLALINWVRFSYRINPCIKDMDSAVKSFSEIKPDEGEEDLNLEEFFAFYYKEYGEKISKIDILIHPWSEFTETLIEDDDAGKILNTHSVSSYFTRDSLLGDRIDLRYYSTFPNILTGLGILGTFIGLVAGIYLASGTLLSNEAQETKKALESLLGGASLSFMTSIAGLFTSLLFSWREKAKIHKFDKLRREWIAALDKRLERVTVESVNQLLHAESKKQTKALESFGEPLAFELTKFADLFTDKMSAAITNNVTAPMSESLSGIQSSVDRLIDTQNGNDENMLKEITEQMAQSITGTASKEIDSFVSATNFMSSNLEQTMDKVTSQLEAASSSFSKSVQGLSQSTGSIQQLVSESSELTKQQQTIIGETFVVQERMTETVDSISDAVSVINSVVEKGAQSSSDIAQSAAAIYGAVEQLDSSNSKVQQIWSEYEKRFDGIDQSLSNVFREIDQATQSYSQNIKFFVEELEKQTSTITRDLAGAISDLSNAIDDQNT